MRWILGTICCGLLLFLAMGGVSADEGVEVLEVEDSSEARIEAVSSALEVLRIRMEARLQEAEVLREMGRGAEALEALKDVDAIFERGMALVEALLERTGAPAPAPVPTVVIRRPDGAVLEGARPQPVVPPGAEPQPLGERTPVRVPPSPNSRRDAVEEALKWLAAHQSPNGGWEAAGFPGWCDMKPVAQGPDGAGKALYDVGVTGLSLLAFLGAGYTNRGQHEFAKTVAKGLRFLKNQQDAEGCFGARTSQHYVYNHAAAALAMVEAYGMTGSPIFKGSAQRALDFCAMSRNPYFGWRYGVKPGENDTSVTGWMLAPIKSAQLINQDAVSRGKPAPLVIDEAAFDGALAWIDKMTDPDYGRVGYIQRGGSPARPMEMIDKFPGDKSEAMTAVGIMIRIWSGTDPRKSPVIKKGAELLLRTPPRWADDGSIDMYYWMYGTMAAFQIGGHTWKRWSAALKEAVIPNQRKDTDYCMYRGSWDPVGPWGHDGGRVYATAMMALALETWYRYDRVFGTR